MANESESPLLGLVAGLGVGAGIFYYRSLVNAHLELGRTARILMTHADVRKVMDLAAARAADELAQYLSGLMGELAAGGAQIGIIPAFSPQICANELAKLTPLPLVSLLDAIVAEVDRRQLRRLAVLGAGVTMETALFGRLQGLAEVVPLRPDELSRVADSYRRIVESEQASKKDFMSLRRLAHTVIDREHLDAIILAGTDLSLVFHPQNTDFPHLDGAAPISRQSCGGANRTEDGKPGGIFGRSTALSAIRRKTGGTILSPRAVIAKVHTIDPQ